MAIFRHLRISNRNEIRIWQLSSNMKRTNELGAWRDVPHAARDLQCPGQLSNLLTLYLLVKMVLAQIRCMVSK